MNLRKPTSIATKGNEKMTHSKSSESVNVGKNKSEKNAGVILKDNFKKHLLPNINAYANKNNKTQPDVVELHYFLCWGYGTESALPEFISQEKETIENFRTFMNQENASQQNPYAYKLKVHLSPNKNNPAMVEKCNSQIQNLLEDLKANDQFIEQDQWRESAARIAASCLFDQYYSNQNMKTALDEMLKTDSKEFVSKHDGYSENDSFEHYKSETKDILALLKPTMSNTHAPRDNESKNTYMFLLSRHGLCRIMNHVLKESQSLGYLTDNFSHSQKLPVKTPPVNQNVIAIQNGMFGNNSNKKNKSTSRSSSKSQSSSPSNLVLNDETHGDLQDSSNSPSRSRSSNNNSPVLSRSRSNSRDNLFRMFFREVTQEVINTDMTAERKGELLGSMITTVARTKVKS